jgi:hypothetical protein
MLRQGNAVTPRYALPFLNAMWISFASGIFPPLGAGCSGAGLVRFITSPVSPMIVCVGWLVAVGHRRRRGGCVSPYASAPPRNERGIEVVAPHPWYNSKRWKVRRTQQMQRQPLCELCLREGRIVAATVADHITPHRGDYDLFFNGALQSLCKHHHNKVKQSIEEHGYDNSCDVDGRPLDPNHPSLTFK